MASRAPIRPSSLRWTAGLLLALPLLAAGCGGGGRPDLTFDADRALAVLESLLAHGPRYSGSPAMARQQELVRSTLEGAGARVVEQRFPHTLMDTDEEVTLVNLCGRFLPERTDRVALLTHYDARRWAENDPDPAQRDLPIAGANDGGSGTAILLELARVMGERPPPVGVDLWFFDGEEAGKPDRGGYCEGSRHLERTWAEVYPEPPRWAICIDMVGDADLLIPKEKYSLTHGGRHLTEAIWAAAAVVGAPALQDQVRPHTIEDDHTAFLRRGVPATLLIDYDYRDPEGRNVYHTQGDVLERVGRGSLEQIGRLLEYLIYTPQATASVGR